MAIRCFEVLKKIFNIKRCSWEFDNLILMLIIKLIFFHRGNSEPHINPTHQLVTQMPTHILII